MDMEPKKHPIWILSIIALLAGIGCAWLIQSFSTPAKPEEEILPITLIDINNEAHRLDAWKGKVVVVNFWATWCPPCVKEIPMLVEFQHDLAAKNIQVVSISVDSKESAKKFAEENGINFPVLMAGTLAPQLATEYGNNAGALPFTAIVNQEGKIVERFLGAITRDQLNTAIDPLL